MTGHVTCPLLSLQIKKRKDLARSKQRKGKSERTRACASVEAGRQPARRERRRAQHGEAASGSHRKGGQRRCFNLDAPASTPAPLDCSARTRHLGPASSPPIPLLRCHTRSPRGDAPPAGKDAPPEGRSVHAAWGRAAGRAPARVGTRRRQGRKRRTRSPPHLSLFYPSLRPVSFLSPSAT